ncbi:MAG: FluC/FEX family fluoride channel [Flavobacteriales bacterium]
MNLTSIAAVFLGGGLGSTARYLLGFGINKWSAVMPWSTLAANVLATGILALIWKHAPHLSQSTWGLLWMTGFCGGFSTFSTFSLDTFHLYQNHGWSVALLNVLFSVVACLGLLAWVLSTQVEEGGLGNG